VAVTETAAAPRIYPVGAVVAGVRRLLEERIGSIWVVGEISNLRRVASGHTYFTLKDAEGQLRAALFRGSARRLAFEPEDGLEVLVYGQITVYGERGRAADRGARARAARRRRAPARVRAAAPPARREGDCSPPTASARCRACRARGIATSASGAALRDVLEGGAPASARACRCGSRVPRAGARRGALGGRRRSSCARNTATST
jgi:exodeoxyribonuclease VII large subunit